MAPLPASSHVQPLLPPRDLVTIYVRNTFLHCTDCEEPGEGAPDEQPTVRRARTAPVAVAKAELPAVLVLECLESRPATPHDTAAAEAPAPAGEGLHSRRAVRWQEGAEESELPSAAAAPGTRRPRGRGGAGEALTRELPAESDGEQEGGDAAQEGPSDGSPQPWVTRQLTDDPFDSPQGFFAPVLLGRASVSRFGGPSVVADATGAWSCKAAGVNSAAHRAAAGRAGFAAVHCLPAREPLSEPTYDPLSEPSCIASLWCGPMCGPLSKPREEQRASGHHAAPPNHGGGGAAPLRNAEKRVAGLAGRAADRGAAAAPPRVGGGGPRAAPPAGGAATPHQPLCRLPRKGHGGGGGGTGTVAEGSAAEQAALPRSATQEGAAIAAAPRTTVMLQNLPNNYTRSVLKDLLDTKGFAGRFDFLYFPVDFRTHAALGYAFVNLLTAADAEAVRKALHGFSQWSLPSNKVCSVGWSQQHGLEANVARYRNSPLMHESVPDNFRPAVFNDGKRVPFPPPTKRIKVPRQGAEKMFVKSVCSHGR